MSTERIFKREDIASAIKACGRKELIDSELKAAFTDFVYDSFDDGMAMDVTNASEFVEICCEVFSWDSDEEVK